MLVALTEHQELFQITKDLSREMLLERKYKEKFFCPQCKEQLLLKAGQIKIPHFAHRKSSECDSFFSEGETLAHLMGKQQLFTFFSKRNVQTELEPFLSEIQQRPDLLISHNDQQFAIEFQCSKIPPEVVQRRSKGYTEIDIHPIWLIQTPNARFKALGLTKLSINYTNSQYIQMYKKQRYLITYDVHSEMFYYVSNLIPIHRLQYYGVIQALPLMQQSFPFFLPKVMSVQIFNALMLRFIAYRNQYVHSRLLLSKKGVNDDFLRAVYELQLTPLRMPDFIGIPVSFAQDFEVFCVEWQVQLFYFMHCHKLTPQKMNVQAIPYFMQWAKIKGQGNSKKAVTYYLALLKKLEIENVTDEVSRVQLFQFLYNELVAFG